MAATCKAPGCDRPIVDRSEKVCHKHYMRLRRKGSIDDKRKNARKTCTVDDCDKLTVAKGLCNNHYVQATRKRKPKLRYGRICERCGGGIPPERNARAKFCSVQCKNKTTEPERMRRYQLKKKYGITPEEFDQMLERQNGGCGICGATEPNGRGRFHVDHCHYTDQVRGLLCTTCNTSLGGFNDDPKLLEAAIRYLR